MEGVSHISIDLSRPGTVIGLQGLRKSGESDLALTRQIVSAVGGADIQVERTPLGTAIEAEVIAPAFDAGAAIIHPEFGNALTAGNAGAEQAAHRHGRSREHAAARSVEVRRIAVAIYPRPAADAVTPEHWPVANAGIHPDRTR